MKLIVILGPQAVGKMTVGQELARLTGLKLFHNHMSIELASNFFSYGTPEGKALVRALRRDVFESVAASQLPGLIFTYVWEFDEPSYWEYMQELHELYASHGAEIYYVELFADFQVRIGRNVTENRLLNKPTKRDLAWSDAAFRRTEANHRLNSYEGELNFKNYMRIDNTNLSPETVARRIIEEFSF